jgi:hypothetical protein
LIFGVGSAVGLCALHDVERDAGCLDEAGAAEGSRDDLVVTEARAEESPQLDLFATENASRVMLLEASRGPGAFSNAAQWR